MKIKRIFKAFIFLLPLCLGSILSSYALLAAEGQEPVDIELLDFEVWQRESGYWYGEYTFLNGSGISDYKAIDDPTSGQYDYRKYYGFINLQVKGNELVSGKFS